MLTSLKRSAPTRTNSNDRHYHQNRGLVHGTGGSGSGGGSGATRLSTYACAHASSVTEPKSHSSLPKHLSLHTEESLDEPSSDKLYKSVFSGITAQVGATFVKLTEKAKDALGGSWLLQSVAPLRSTILISDELDRVAS